MNRLLSGNARGESRGADVDDFVLYDDKKIKWSHTLKQDLKRGRDRADFSQDKIRTSLKSPFYERRIYILIG